MAVTSVRQLQVFQQMIRRMSKPDQLPLDAELAAFATSPAVCAAYFVFDLEPDGGTEMFVTHTLGRILQQLSRSTERRQVELEGQVRGRVLWAPTLKARYEDGYHPDRFVCGEVTQDFDTPENQLLQYMLSAIQASLRAVPGIMRAGICCPLEEAGVLPEQLGVRLGRMEGALRQANRSIRLRGLSAPPTVSEFHLLRAETAQLKEYAQVARLYRHYRDLVLAPTWTTLAAAGQRVCLLPGTPDATGDLWIQLSAELLRSSAQIL